MTLSGQELQAISAERQTLARPRADQKDLTCVARTARRPPQTNFGKNPRLFWRGLPVARREQDVPTLLCESEYRPRKHRSDNCPKESERDNGRRTRHWRFVSAP